MGRGFLLGLFLRACVVEWCKDGTSGTADTSLGSFPPMEHVRVGGMVDGAGGKVPGTDGATYVPVRMMPWVVASSPVQWRSTFVSGASVDFSLLSSTLRYPFALRTRRTRIYAVLAHA